MSRVLLSLVLLVSFSGGLLSTPILMTLDELEELDRILTSLETTLQRSRLDLITSQEDLRREQAKLELLQTDLISLSEKSRALSTDLTKALTTLEEVKLSLRKLENELAWKDLERWIWGGAGIIIGGLLWGAVNSGR